MKFTLCLAGTLKTVQLSFNNVADKLNKNTALWRKEFGDELKKVIAEVSDMTTMNVRFRTILFQCSPTI